MNTIVIEAAGFEDWEFEADDIKSIVAQAVILAKEDIQFKLIEKKFTVESTVLADFR